MVLKKYGDIDLCIVCLGGDSLNSEGETMNGKAMGREREKEKKGSRDGEEEGRREAKWKGGEDRERERPRTRVVA